MATEILTQADGSQSDFDRRAGATSAMGEGFRPAISDSIPTISGAGYGDPQIVERRADPLHLNGGRKRMDDDEVVDTLNELLECCRDGEHGYKECAEHVKTPDLKNMMFNHARHFAAGAAELEAQIRQHGGKPDAGGSVSAALHRGWVSVRSVLTGRSEQAMLEECEREEVAALARYRRVLRQRLPQAVRAVVQVQFDGVQRDRDQIEAVRDSLRAANQRP